MKPIEKVAVRFYLYAPQTSKGMRDYSFESKLADLENLFGRENFWSNVAEGFVDLSDDTVRKSISLLAAVMFLRSPLRLENYRKVHRGLIDFYKQDGVAIEDIEEVEINNRSYKLDISDWEDYKNANEERLKQAWVKDMRSAIWLAKIIMNMRWSAYSSEEPVFITSDNPVFLLHQSKEAFGFNTPGTIVVFPASSKRILIFDHAEEPANQYYAAKASSSINYLVWRNSFENMFSPRHPDEVCREMLAKFDSEQGEQGHATP